MKCLLAYIMETVQNKQAYLKYPAAYCPQSDQKTEVMTMVKVVYLYVVQHQSTCPHPVHSLPGFVWQTFPLVWLVMWFEGMSLQDRPIERYVVLDDHKACCQKLST